MLDTIKGELRVFTKEVERPNGEKRVLFNACIGSTKLEDDSYLNYYIGLAFSSAVKKQVAKVYTQDSFDILIKEAWIKAYSDRDGNVKPLLFINNATIVSKDDKPAEKKV